MGKTDHRCRSSDFIFVGKCKIEFIELSEPIVFIKSVKHFKCLLDLNFCIDDDITVLLEEIVEDAL